MDIEAYSHQLIQVGRRQLVQDLKLAPVADGYEVLFRQGHQVTVYQRLSVLEGQQLIARFKFLGGMDVGEKRKAQVGAITYQSTAFQQRLRLSAVGDYRQRESMVLRFLYGLTESELHFFIPAQYQILREMTAKAQLYLFSGPTGSGKTTLMYHLAQATKGEVITIEDPVEIIEESFLQLQVNPKIQQDYDQLIQLSLRHRPDVLIIGEIRDAQTAQGAIRAALTGHKVFATVHARGVNETEARIRDLVGNDSELTHCLGGIIYQQLLKGVDQKLRSLLSYRFHGEACQYQNWQDNMALILKEGLYEALQ